MKIKNRITRIIEEEKLLSGDDAFDDILRRLKSNPAYLPSLSTVVKIAEKYDLSADFVLGLTDSPTPLLNKLDTDFVSVNLKKFAQTFPTKFYLLKKLGLTKDFPSFSNWLKGKNLPDICGFVRLAEKLNVSACELLKSD